MVVDLPAPFGPSNPKISPRLICKSTPLTAVNIGFGSRLPNGHRFRFEEVASVLLPAPGRAGNFLTSWLASIANSDITISSS
jgi:hypothetical protein